MDNLTDLLDRLIHTGLLALAAVSLIVFGAKHPYGRTAAIVLAALLLLAFALRSVLAGELRLLATPLDLAIVAALALILVQLGLGYPWGWGSPPPGDALLARAAAAPGALPSVPGTLDFHATRQALVLFLVYVIVYYLTIHSLRSRFLTNRLTGGLVVLVSAVAGYGLLEFLSGNHGILGWKGFASHRVRGTLVNPDHFAATLGMLVPMAVAFLIALTAKRRRSRRHHRGSESQESAAATTVDPGPSAIGHQGSGPSPSSSISDNPQSEIRNPQVPSSPHPSPLTPHPSPAHPSPEEEEEPSLFERHHSFRAGEKESRRYLLLLAAIFLVAAAFFTMSRAGIVALLAGGAFFTALLWIREARHRRRLTALAAVLAALAVIAWIGAEPVLSRFVKTEVDAQSRGLLYRMALQTARDFPVLGTGLGSYERVSPRYAPPEMASAFRIDHAHSEPLELLAEAGISGILILLFALCMLFKEVLFRRLLGIGADHQGSEGSAPSSSSSISDNPQSPIRNPKSPIPNPQSPIPNSQSSLHASIRHDPYNIALGFGTLAAVVTILVHSCFDFPLRIPANAILLAMILGIGVAAVAVRFHTDRAEPLAPERVVALSSRGKLLAFGGALVVALFMVWTAVASLVGDEFTRRGIDMVLGGGPAEGRTERPWIVETAKNKEALGYLAGAVAFDPMNPDAHHFLGRLYDQLALRTWNAGLSEEGKFIPDAPGRAQAAVKLLDQAAAEYGRAIALAPPLAESWAQLGWSTGGRGLILGSLPGQAADKDYAGLALTGLRQAIALNPNSRYRHEMLASFGLARLERRADFSDPVVRESLKALRQAVELDPLYLPEALARLLRSTQDLAVLQAAIPSHGPDHLFAARLLEGEERWPEAKFLYRQAIELAPDDAKPLYYREYAEALTRHREDAETRDVLAVVLRFDPQNLNLKIAMARSLDRLSMKADALAMFQDALEMAGKSADAPIASRPLGSSAAQLFGPPARTRRLTREEVVLAEIQKRFPESRRDEDQLTAALGGLASFYHGAGQYNLAVPLWEKALKRTPDDAAAAFGLAKSYDAVGAWVSALDFYKRAIELQPGNVEYRLTLADRYFDNEMNFQAINLWREVLAVRPLLVETRLKLAQAYIRLEQYPDALREYERVLQIDPQNGDARSRSLQLRGRLPGV